MTDEERFAPIAGYPVFEEDKAFGFFGWGAYVVDLSVRRNDAATLREMMRRGFVSKNSRVLDGQSLREWCEKSGAAECAAVLA